MPRVIARQWEHQQRETNDKSTSKTTHPPPIRHLRGLVRGSPGFGRRALAGSLGPGANALRGMGRRRDATTGLAHGGPDTAAKGSGRIITSPANRGNL
jgi:hypothetical protein